MKKRGTRGGVIAAKKGERVKRGKCGKSGKGKRGA